MGQDSIHHSFTGTDSIPSPMPWSILKTIWESRARLTATVMQPRIQEVSRLGAQWSLGKHVCLEWSIMGLHFGISSGNFDSDCLHYLFRRQDQQEVEDRLNDIEIPMFEQQVTVTSSGAKMVFDGPWGGLRGRIVTRYQVLTHSARTDNIPILI